MLLTIYLQFKSAVWFPKRAKSRRAGIRLQEDCREDCIESRVSATGCPIPGKPYCPTRVPETSARNTARRTCSGIVHDVRVENPCMATPAKRAPRGTTRAQPQDLHHARKTPPKVGTRPPRPPEYMPVRTQKYLSPRPIGTLHNPCAAKTPSAARTRNARRDVRPQHSAQDM